MTKHGELPQAVENKIGSRNRKFRIDMPICSFLMRGTDEERATELSVVKQLLSSCRTVDKRY